MRQFAIANLLNLQPAQGLKSIVKAGLVPVVAMSTVVVHTAPVEKIGIVGLLALVSVAVAMWVTRRRGRSREYS